MSSHIATDTSNMSQSIGALSVAHENALNHLQKMSDEIVCLSNMWEGPAKTAFVNQFSDDFQMTEDLLAEIKDTIDSMDYARMQYTICENQVGTIISSISV